MDKYELDVTTVHSAYSCRHHSGIRSFTLTDDGSWAAYVTSLPNKVSGIPLRDCYRQIIPGDGQMV